MMSIYPIEESQVVPYFIFQLLLGIGIIVGMLLLFAFLRRWNPENKYIDVYVLRRCGMITLYKNDTEITTFNLSCWKEVIKPSKSDEWMLNEMKYYKDRFNIPIKSGLADSNYLTKDLSEVYVSKIQKIGVVFLICFVVIAFIMIIIFPEEFLNTAW